MEKQTDSQRFKYKALRVIKTCKNCGEAFITSYYNLGRGQKFCCHKCSTDAQTKPREVRTCLNCDKQFSIGHRNRVEKFCSRKCSNVYNRTRARGKGHSAAGNYTRTRKNYRAVAERKLGRRLKSGEVVHHIDGNHENNQIENLDILKNLSAHRKAHTSVEKLVKELMDKDIVGYKRGKYFLLGKIAG